jgi:phosphocarrier protein HPr
MSTDGWIKAAVTVRNVKGLHARASAKFVTCAGAFEAETTVTRDEQTVGGTSILELMLLAAGPGVELTIAARGHDADKALSALVKLVEDGFGEECVAPGDELY